MVSSQQAPIGSPPLKSRPQVFSSRTKQGKTPSHERPIYKFFSSAFHFGISFFCCVGRNIDRRHPGAEQVASLHTYYSYPFSTLLFSFNIYEAPVLFSLNNNKRINKKKTFLNAPRFSFFRLLLLFWAPHVVPIHIYIYRHVRTIDAIVMVAARLLLSQREYYMPARRPVVLRRSRRDQHVDSALLLLSDTSSMLLLMLLYFSRIILYKWGSKLNGTYICWLTRYALRSSLGVLVFGI